MKNKGYYEDVKENILEMLKERYQNEEELTDYIYKAGSEYYVEFDNKFNHKIYEDAVEDDNITGNLSGSYFCNYYKAREYFLENNGTEILQDAVNEGLIKKEQIADYFLNDDFESLDVLYRDYACGQVFEETVDEFEQYLNENEELLLKEIYIINDGGEEC